jgi:hypothetical protein
MIDCSHMKVIACTLLFYFISHSSFCQPNTSNFNSDSHRKTIEQLREYKEEQKHFDSLSQYHAFSTYSVGITEISASKMVYSTIEERLDTIYVAVYDIKYDKDLKRIISIKKHQ